MAVRWYRFAASAWDAMFGKRCVVQVPGDEGQTRRVVVTKKWLEQMEREGHIRMKGHIREPEAIEAHVLNPAGYEEKRSWRVGEDIEPEMLAQFRDPETNAVYAVEMFEDGTLVRCLASKQAYEFTKAAQSISLSGRALTEDVLQQLAKEKGMM